MEEIDSIEGRSKHKKAMTGMDLVDMGMPVEDILAAIETNE